MRALSLGRLPTEILRRIGSYMSCPSALTFLLVCRSIYQACDDWTVWRDVVRHSPHYPSLIFADDADEWKRYVVAGTKAACSQGDWDTKDLEEWLPQLAAQGHSDVLRGDLSFLHRLCDAVVDTTFRSASTSRELDAHTWKLAQAAAFCLAMQHLAQTASDASSDLLRSVPWFRLVDLDRQEVSAKDRGRLIMMQHALANRAVGFLCAKLRHALVNGNTASQYAAGLYAPPTARTIPFPRLMDLPLPFTPNGPERFGDCHLSAMTDPSFFVDDEWTGCTSKFGLSEVHVNRIGGSHRDGFAPANSGLSTPPGNFPNGRHFEHVVRFHLVEQHDGNQYKLQSNNYHSETDLHNITMTMEKNTGHLTITHWHPLVPDFITSDAVITPFGIVSRLLLSEEYWIWLWKVQWSEFVE
ncbi:hypothetical protein K491DRAFT_784873 [Lophiostoma macrostomum CBS 122681]|uniref:F-box domain-containing protein n=1 Tax=Lophiostoma macrostomum CBS 122681 TaxID=1314788 RepID=A0A6A6SHZ9_9PLEO|nr:hypothetical protein K491DRAFT_784873 [Lophiostoma macrostomum CBS 122681]